MSEPCSSLENLSIRLSLNKECSNRPGSILRILCQWAPWNLRTLRIRLHDENVDLSEFFEPGRLHHLTRLSISRDLPQNTRRYQRMLSNFLSLPNTNLTHVALGPHDSDVRIHMANLRQLVVTITSLDSQLISQFKSNCSSLTQLELRLTMRRQQSISLTDIIWRVFPALSRADALERLKLITCDFGVHGLAGVATYLPRLKHLWWVATDRVVQIGLPNYTNAYCPLPSEIVEHAPSFREWQLNYLLVHVRERAISSELTKMLAPYARQLIVREGTGGSVVEDMLGQWDLKDASWM
ncbi:hypothetical protein DL96DRAFT_1623330 [Flagelloscypha sp. PMI_526]|nr:hypothetical protein DL96DRAFT_1623330 [Flagelloscypha sp. PMI_526]